LWLRKKIRPETQSELASRGLNKKTTLPILSFVLPVQGAFVNTLNQSQFNLSGTCSESGQSVIITSPFAGAADCENGSWSTALNLLTQNNGPIAITIKQTDTVGNESLPLTVEVTKDDEVPQVSVVAAEAEVNILNVEAFEISGTCSEENRPVIISGPLNAEALCQSGSWSKILDMTSVADGPLVLEVNHADTAGNPAITALLTLAKDTSFANLTMNALNVTEGNEATITLTLSKPSLVPISFKVQSADDVAKAGSDFVAIPQKTISLPVGTTTATIPLTTNEDTIFEGPQTFKLVYSDLVNVTANPSASIITILDNEVAPNLTIGDATVTEGGVLEFTVQASYASESNITFDWGTANGTAVGGSDFVVGTGTASILGGQSSVKITVNTTDDFKYEGNETLYVNLSNSLVCPILDGQGVGTISDNDPKPTIAIADVSAIEGTVANFVVSLSSASGKPISFTVNTTAGSAQQGFDYAGVVGQSFTIPAETLSINVPVSLLNDSYFEGDQQFTAKISAVSDGLAITRETATGTITDDEGPPTLSVSDSSASEGGVLKFAVSLNGLTDHDVTFSWASSDGTALAGSDYVANSGTNISIPQGTLSKNILVSTSTDATMENAETMKVTLSSVVGATVADERGDGKIIDPSSSAVLSIAETEVTEAGVAIFTVSLTRPLDDDVTFDWTTSEVTAKAGLDFTTSSGTTVLIAAGTTSTTLSVPTLNDSKDEADETFKVTISNVVNAYLGASVGIGTIHDDTDAPPTISLGGNVTAVEGEALSFTVNLSAPSGQDISFDWSTTSGTAFKDLDFEAVAGDNIVLTEGTTSYTILIPTLQDTLNEDTEQFTLTLSDLKNATGSGLIRTGTINDDGDSAPQVAVNDISATEGQPLVFVISLDKASGKTVSVKAVTSNETAMGGSDFVALASTTYVFAPGDTTIQVPISTMADGKYEGLQTFKLLLDSPVGATIEDQQGVGTIIDSEAIPSLTISSVSVNEGSHALFTVTSSGLTESNITFNWVTMDGTAIAPDDYTSVAQTQGVITAGSLKTTLTVSTAADSLDESDEKLAVKLSSPSNAVISVNQAEATIVDPTKPLLSVVESTSATEGSSLVFTVSLSKTSASNITFNWATSHLTAGAADYTVGTGTKTIPAGSLSTTVSINTTQDTIFETDETLAFTVTSSAVGVSAGESVGTILNDDSAPSITINDVTLETEGASATFTVTLSKTSSVNTSVEFETTNGTALAGSDFNYQKGQLTIPPGQLTGTITVQTVNDTLSEPIEDFFITLTNPGNATINDGLGKATIPKSDNKPPVAYDQNFTLASTSTNGVSLTLNNIDPENDPLLMTLVANPQHGSVVGVPPTITYLPSNGYTGPDSFRYYVSDGEFKSNEATVTLNITTQINYFNYASQPVYDKTAWLDVVINPLDTNTFYAIDILGYVKKTTDQGATWKVLCKTMEGRPSSPDYVYSQLEVAANDGQAYVQSQGYIQLVSDKNGGLCTRVNPLNNGVSYHSSGTTGRAVVIHPTSGNLYIFAGNKLYKSRDKGTSWDVVFTYSVEGKSFYYGSVFVDPLDEQKMSLFFMVLTNNNTTWEYPVYRSNDGGGTFSSSNSLGNFILNVFKTAAKPSEVYATQQGGYKSTDNGLTWTSSSAHYNYERDVVLLPSGVAYRIMKVDRTAVIQKAPDFSNPTWTALSGGTFNLEQTDTRDSIDVVGNTIIATIQYQMYLSKDGGATFTRIENEGPSSIFLTAAVAFASVDSKTIYALTKFWDVFKSTDGGNTFALKHTTNDITNTKGRLQVHAMDPNRYLATQPGYQQSPGVASQRTIRSIDGGATNTASDSLGYSYYNYWNLSLALSPVDLNKTYFITGGPIGVSNDFMATKVDDPGGSFTGSHNRSYLSDVSVISAFNTNIVWIVENNALMKYDHSLRWKMDYSAKTGLGTTIATIEYYRISETEYKLLAIGTNGQIAASTDEGEHFTPIDNSTKSSCSRRLFASSPLNRDIMITGCDGGSRVDITSNAGKTWTTYNDLNCPIQGLTFSPKFVLIACHNQTPMRFPYQSIEPTPVKVQWAQASQSVNENVNAVGATLNLDTASNQIVDVHYKIAGTSTFNQDHNLVDGVLSFAPGETTKTVYFNIINDAFVESSETVILKIDKVVNAQLGAHVTHTVTINADSADNPKMTLSSLSTYFSAVGGGGSLTLTGSNFANGVTVKIDGAACAVTATLSTSITCGPIPAHASGTVKLVVQNPDGQTASETFTYYQESTALTLTSSATTIKSGEAFSVRVKVVDAFGSVVGSDSTTSITLSLGTNPGGALTGTLTKTVTHGAALFSDLKLDKALSGYVLAATASTGATVNSLELTVIPGAPHSLLVQTQPSSTVGQNTVLATQPIFHVLDSAGNLVVADNTTRVTLVETSNTDRILGTATRTAASGVVSFSGIRIDLTGLVDRAVTLTATGSEGVLPVTTNPITVLANNRTPVASDQTIDFIYDDRNQVGHQLTLSTYDPDGDPLTATIIRAPLHGTLEGTPPALRYVVSGDYLGSDSFQYKVSDGQLESSVATVSLNFTKRIAILDVAKSSNGGRYWVKVAVDPNTANRIIGLGDDLMIYETTNGGTTWTARCSTPSNSYNDLYNLNLFISKGPDATAYFGNQYIFYKVIPGGGACPAAQPYSNNYYMYSTRFANGADTTKSSGALYVWNQLAIGGVYGGRVVTSTDQSASWNVVSMQPAMKSPMGLLIINPHNENEMLVTQLSNAPTDGIYRSTDGGVTFSLKATTGFTSLTTHVKYDPGHSGYVYSNTGYYSSNGGSTWSNDARYSMPEDWDIDNNGAGYKATYSGANLLIQKAPDMRNPAWATLSGGTIANTASGTPECSIAVSGNGATIAVLVQDRFYLSTDSGATFKRINFSAATVLPVASVDTADGNTLFAVDSYWRVFKSTNTGSSWVYVFSTGNGIRQMGYGTARLRVVDSTHVYIRSGNEYGATGFISTSDGFASVVKDNINEVPAHYYYPDFINIADPNFYATGVNTNYRKTANAGATFTDTTVSAFGHYYWGSANYTQVNREGWVNPANTNKVWMEVKSLFEVDISNNTSNDLTSRIPNFTDVAGFTVVKKTNGTYRLWAVNVNGQMAYSDDGAATFTSFAPTTASPGVTCADKRYLEVLSNNQNVMAMACQNSQIVSYSKDGGLTWADATVSNCGIIDMALTNQGKVYLSCGYYSPGVSVDFE
jgi:hypothetical protein